MRGRPRPDLLFSPNRPSRPPLLGRELMAREAGGRPGSPASNGPSRSVPVFTSAIRLYACSAHPPRSLQIPVGMRLAGFCFGYLRIAALRTGPSRCARVLPATGQRVWQMRRAMLLGPGCIHADAARSGQKPTNGLRGSRLSWPGVVSTSSPRTRSPCPDRNGMDAAGASAPEASWPLRWLRDQLAEASGGPGQMRGPTRTMSASCFQISASATCCTRPVQ